VSTVAALSSREYRHKGSGFFGEEKRPGPPAHRQRGRATQQRHWGPTERLLANRRSSLAAGLAQGTPTLAYVAAGCGEVEKSPIHAERPPRGGLGRPREARLRRHGYARANLPRSVFWKRAACFLVWISRVRAAYNVAAGVLPAGLVQ